MTATKPLMALIDRDHVRRQRMERLAWALGVRCTSGAAIPGVAKTGHIVALLVDDIGGIPAARAAFPSAKVIAAGLSSVQGDAVAAFRAGADDFIWLGAGDAELSQVLSRHMGACAAGATSVRTAAVGDGLIGVSAAIANLRAFIAKLAPTAATVLITGETGTGKDVAAVLIHRLSRRAAKPLVALNCAAIPDALLEGELFGYERGSFSGAHAAYPGKLKLADGGTLLLDEIGELSLAGQAKLLRAIETREVWRLGGRAPVQFDVRIVAVTNRDLSGEVRAGRFREDLFYRLAVSQLWLPPLRERRDDVAPLANHLLGQLAREAGCAVPQIESAALHRLQAHDWPGNVRELRNALEIAMIGTSGTTLRSGDLPAHIRAGEAIPFAPPRTDERAALVAALGDANGNKSLAAQHLKCSRMTLYRRLHRHGVVEPVAVTP